MIVIPLTNVGKKFRPSQCPSKGCRLSTVGSQKEKFGDEVNMKNATRTQNRCGWLLARVMMHAGTFALMSGLVLGQSEFHLQEATITDIHDAIKAGQITCQGVVQAYINRAKAYNGGCTQHRRIDDASSHADQHDVLGRTGLRFRCDQGSLSL